MIWIAGTIVADDELKISARDRAFEHGLGLFETLRAWNGKAVLLDRHLERMTRSAQALGLRCDPSALPDAKAVADLLRSDRHGGDALLRITLSGGSDARPSVLWMRSAALPPPMPESGAVLAITPWAVESGHPLVRHKTLNFWDRRLAYESARGQGADEALLTTRELGHCEGSRANLFIVADNTLATPALSAPIIPGIMRRLVIEQARTLGLEIRETPSLNDSDLLRASEVFLTNSVRGIIPVAAAGAWRRPAPGPITRLLKSEITNWITSRGPVSP